MASRKDQLHSYQFMLQRAISALIMRETDPAQSPLRRGVGAAFVGVMVTVIVAAAFGIYGLLTKTGSSRWRVDNAVVVEKETGAAFVYLGDELIPTLNSTSAMLLAGQSPPKRFTVPRNSLAGVPRGAPVGIVGAPSSLPDTKHLLAGAWTSCRVPAKDVAGQATAATVLMVGTTVRGGRAVGDEGLYVRDATTGGEFLLWHGHRYQLGGQAVAAALFASGVEPTDVGSAWLNALPEADRINEIVVPGAGDKSKAVAGRKVGDVLTDRRDAGRTNYLVLDDGLALLTPLQMDLLNSTRTITPVPVPPNEIAKAPTSTRLTSTSPAAQRPPERRPAQIPIPAESGLCAEFDASGDPAPGLAVVGGDTVGDTGIVTTKQTGEGGTLADRVVMNGGAAVVVRDRESGTYAVVTDQGKRFPVESAEALSMLGYGDAFAVTMPRALLSRIPTGPPLTRAGAATPAA